MTIDTETNEQVGVFVLKGLRYGEPIQETLESLEDAISRACSWSELRGALYVGWAAPTVIEDGSGNIIMDEKKLSDEIDKHGW